jgi:lysosomal acid lipase/cholesteryl ester hydrolase
MSKSVNCVWQGTLIALASFSEGKLVNQLKSAALLSPIAYLSHMNTALGVIAAKSFIGEVHNNTTSFNPLYYSYILLIKYRGHVSDIQTHF